MKLKKLICIFLVLTTIVLLSSCGYDPDKEDLNSYVKLGDLNNLTYEIFNERYQEYRQSNAHTHGGFVLNNGDTIDMYMTCEIVNVNGEETTYIPYDALTYTGDKQCTGYDIGLNDKNRTFEKCLKYQISKSSEISNVRRTVQIGTSFTFTYDVTEDYAPANLIGKTLRFTILITKIVPTGTYYSMSELSDYSDASVRDYIIEFFNKYAPNKDVVEDGDWVVIDYEGKLSGTDTEFTGNKAEDDAFRVGDGYLWPTFEKELIGKKSGDEFSITLTVPSTNANKEIAGKDVDYKIKIKKVYSTETTINQNTGYASYGELANDLRVYLYTQATIMDLITERATLIAVPPKMYEQYKKFNSNFVNSQIDEFIEYYETTYYTSYTREQAFQYLFSAVGIDLYIDKLTETDVFNVLVAYQTKKALNLEYTEEDYKEDLKSQVILESANDGVAYTEKEIENIYTKERLKGYFIQMKCGEALFEKVTGFKYKPDTK